MNLKSTIKNFKTLDNSKKHWYLKKILEISFFSFRYFIKNPKGSYADNLLKSSAAHIYLSDIRAGSSMVGYNIIYIYETTLKGAPISIIRSDAAILERHRKNNITLKDALRAALIYKISHPFRKIYFLGYLIHPGVYKLFARISRSFYPNYKYDAPDYLRTVIQYSGEELFKLDYKLNNDGVKLWHIGRVTKEENPDEWSQSNDHHIKYFVEANPFFQSGYALATIFELSFKELLFVFLRYFINSFLKPSA